MVRAAARRKGSFLERGLPLLVVCYVVLLALLVVARGGFYAEDCVPYAVAFLVLAVLGCAFAARSRGEVRLPICGALLAAVAVFGTVAACVHGSALADGLIACCPWLMAAVAACAVANFSEGERRACRIILAWTGVVSGILGILMLAGVVVWPGGVSANRINFTFQYANTAGIWFAACALLALSSSSKALRIASASPIAALVLTRSVGAIVLFAGALVVLGVRGFMKADEKGRKRFAIVGVIVLVALAAVAAWFLASGRIAQAEGTFVERLQQMRDALVLFAADPLWGLGPDGWRDAYLAVRSADYVSTAVHCGYLQVALDAGAFGLIALVAALGLGVFAALKRSDVVGALIVGLLAIHAFVDIDLHFGAILVLLALFLDEPSVPLTMRRKSR